jgi:hypothetical protein
MKIIHPKIILGFLVLFLTLNAFSQTETYDIVTFAPPQSWKRDTQPGYIAFTASKGISFCVIGLYKSRPIADITESEFLTEWNELVNIPSGINVTPVVKSSQQNGCTVFFGSTSITTKQSGTYNVELTSFAADGNIISAIVKSAGDFYKKESDAFLASFSLLKKEPVIATPVAEKVEIKPTSNTSKEVKMDNSGINGVWVGYEKGGWTYGATSYNYYTNSYNYGSKYDANIVTIKWRVFWSDGKYYDGMPLQGLVNFNRNDPKNDFTGYYTVDKSYITAKLDHYPSTERVFVFYPHSTLKFLDKFEYVKCKPVDGLRLKGAYMSADPTSVAYYQSLSKPVATINFTTDGHFTDNYLLSDYSNEPALAPGSGTYEIKDFTITFKFNDGRIVARSFTPHLDESPATCKVFYIGSNDIKLVPRN